MSNLRKIKRASVEVRKQPPVLIVRPHKFGGVTCQDTSTFIDKAIARGIADRLCYASTTPDLARNKGIAEFLSNRLLHGRKSHLFFIDDDSTPCNDFAIERLLNLKKDVVCGLTPIFRVREAIDFTKARQMLAGLLRNEPIKLDFHWSAIIETENGKMENIGIDELPKRPFKARRVGGTCMLIHRRVLEKLEPPYQKFEFDENHVGVTRSEDIYFSDKIREAGFDIWVDPETICHHYHTIDIRDIFLVAVQARQMGYREAIDERKREEN